MLNEYKTISLAEFSSRLCKYQDFPQGCEIKLYKYKNNRMIRSDFNVQKIEICQKNIDKLADSANVRDFLNCAEKLFITDLHLEGLELLLFYPNGTRVNGNTLLTTIRGFLPLDVQNTDPALDKFIELCKECGLDNHASSEINNLYQLLLSITNKKIIDDLLKYGI